MHRSSFMMECNLNKTFTEQGRETPVPVGDAGGRAGPSRPSASDCSAFPVGDQAGMPENATGKGEEKDRGTDKRKEKEKDKAAKFFASFMTKKAGVGRLEDDVKAYLKRSFSEGDFNSESEKERDIGSASIPLDRTMVATEKGADSETETMSSPENSDRKNKKRKRNVGVSVVHNYKKNTTQKGKRASEAAQLLEGLKQVEKYMGKVEDIIATMYRPKEDLKENVNCLSRSVHALTKNVDITRWLNECVTSTSNWDTKNTAESKMTETGTQTVEEPYPAHGRREMATQTDAGSFKTVKSQAIQTQGSVVDGEIATLVGVDKYEKWQEIARKPWDLDLFKTTTVDAAGIIGSTKDIKIILLENTAKIEQLPELRDISCRVPEILEVEEGYELFEQNTKIKGRPGKHQTKITVMARYGDTDWELWHAMERALRDVVMYKKDIALFIDDVNRLERVQQMAECLMQNVLASDMCCAICVPDKQKNKILTSKTPIPGGVKTLMIKPEKGQNEQDQNEKETYAQMIRKIRKEVDFQEAGVKVITVKKTKEEGATIRLIEKRRGAAEIFRKKLADIVGAQNVEKKQERQMEIFVKDLEETITTEEINEAVRKTLQKKTEIKVLKPIFNEAGLGMATVIIGITDGKELLEKKRIRIGWQRFRVEEKIRLERCFKCQKFGHRTYECKDQQTAPKCLRCGDEEHKTNKCDVTTLKCYVCGEKGHRADSLKCKIYKELVEKNRSAKGVGGKVKTNTNDNTDLTNKCK